MAHTIAVALASLVFLLTPLHFAMVTKFLPVTSQYLILFLLAVLFIEGRRPRDFRPSAALVVSGAALLAYLAANALITPDAGDAYVKVAQALWFLAVGVIGVRATALLREREKRRFASRIVIGAIAGFAVALVEIASGFQITAWFFENWPELWSERHKGIVAEGGAPVRVEAYLFNRNAAGIAMILWPALLIALSWPRRRIGRAAAILLAVLAAVTVGLSDSFTAKVALVGGLAVLLVARRWPTAAHWVLVACWVAGFALAVPVAGALRSTGVANLEALPPSARSRLLIWDYTARQVGQRPLFGIGLRGTRHYQEAAEAEFRQRTGKGPDEFMLQERPGWHAHNLFLQTWYETGAVGAVLYAAFGLAILGALRRAASWALPWSYALFATAVLVMSFGWGMWQSWLMAAVALSAIAMSLAAAFADDVRGAAR